MDEKVKALFPNLATAFVYRTAGLQVSGHSLLASVDRSQQVFGKGLIYVQPTDVIDHVSVVNATAVLLGHYQMYIYPHLAYIFLGS